MALKSASDGTERKRIEWLPENKLLCLRRRSRSLEPTPTQLASLPPAPPLIERVYNTAGCWWALNGPASVLPVLASKPSPQAQGLASGAGTQEWARSEWATTRPERRYLRPSPQIPIECVYSVCFLIVIGEAAARGERAEGSVATGTPFCRSGLLRSGSAGYCAGADMAASESSFRVFAAQL